MSRAVPVAQRKIAIELVRKGATYKEAARRSGHADHTVRAWCIAIGVKAVPRQQRIKGYARLEDRPDVVRFLDQGHSVAETATRYHYTPAAIREVERMEARRRAREAAGRERLRVRQNPPPEIVAQIVAFWNEGRSEIPGNPGFIAAGIHNRRELYAKFDSVDPRALDRIVRGAR